ncbi:MAG: chorismate mutase [Cloacibacillus evryensis]
MLKEYREEIRELDEKILALIERRLEAARAIAEYKMDRNIPITDAAQEESVIDHVVSLAKREDDIPYIRRFWRMMLENSRAVQHKVVTGDNIRGCGCGR